MRFNPTPEALDLKAGVENIKAIANWTLRRRRYRAPSADEACRAGIGIRYAYGAQVVRDEGLLFIRDGDTIHVHTLAQLGL